MKFAHHKYTYSKPFGSERHNWELVGPNGAVSFHTTIVDREKYAPKAGLEFHHRSGNDAPSQLNCPLTGGLCWHDGTSLYATESLWPQVESHLSNGDHESVFRILEWEYEKRFESEAE